MDAISNSGARAVFSRGNPGVVECTITPIYGALERPGRLPSSLLGLIQPVFPPRNPGRLTGNMSNSPKATISQPLPSSQVSLWLKNISWDVLLYYSQTNYLTKRHISYHTPFSPSLSSAQLPTVALSCFSLQAGSRFH
ncbi:Hypothetical predicted protein [Xyrichtys novacula]|uniref:Uncharacterized protein n=1 Tax=Xyrichtys novacula TaxID=13765 RepID=A0AAV1GR52_XYRNO|nr:Hypothetical predicted protein [Xyrichtys novacula]